VVFSRKIMIFIWDIIQRHSLLVNFMLI